MTENKHVCKASMIFWEKEARIGDDILFYRGTCDECGKWWDEVFVKLEGYFDVGNNEYVYKMGDTPNED